MASTRYASKTHTYKGHTIYPCERAQGEHAGRWIVQSHHKTGMPYADELCAHFWTLATAREYIDETAQQERE